MNSIHPTALIGPHVRLGKGNTIGPFAVLAGTITMGDDNWIGSGARLGVPPEVRSAAHTADWSEYDGPGLVIGDGNVLREDVQVQTGWQRETVLGDGLFLMYRSYVAHDVRVGDGVTMAAGASVAGHVVLGAGANLGVGALVHQRRVIGALAMVGMGSVVTRDIPPFALAYGSPCRVQGVNRVGLERSGAERDEIDALERMLAHGEAPAPTSEALRRHVTDFQAAVAA